MSLRSLLVSCLECLVSLAVRRAARGGWLAYAFPLAIPALFSFNKMKKVDNHDSNKLRSWFELCSYLDFVSARGYALVNYTTSTNNKGVEGQGYVEHEWIRTDKCLVHIRSWLGRVEESGETRKVLSVSFEAYEGEDLIFLEEVEDTCGLSVGTSQLSRGSAARPIIIAVPSGDHQRYSRS